MTPKHCSDERLLAWLDGEQGLLAAAMTRRHLQACWECRTRVAQLEDVVHGVAEARGRGRFLTTERVEEARVRVLHRIEMRERAEVAPVLWRRVAAYGLLGSLCLAGAVGLWDVWRPGAAVVSERPVVVPQKSAEKALPVEARAVAPRLSEPVGVMVSPVVGEVAGRVSGDGDVAMVWGVLHELGLCRERAVRLEEMDGGMRLVGVVSSGEVRERLRARLEGVPVRLELQAVDEIGVTGVAGATGGERVVRVVAPGEALLVEWLRGQGVSARDAEARSGEIANGSVMAADLAWSEAWALRDLAGRFGGKWRELPEHSRAVVLSMARDHRSELQTLAARQRRLIGAILPSGVSAGSDVFADVEGWMEAAQELFAPAKTVEMDARVLARRIAVGLASVEAMGGEDGALVGVLRMNFRPPIKADERR
ncbi:MAG: hypothetical protein U0R19_14460 [Bryobacteraceae bacterium]